MSTQPKQTEIEKRRDEAVRRALNTPPKHQKDYVKGTGQKKKAKASASPKKGA
jgi:hypothetical protein